MTSTWDCSDPPRVTLSEVERLLPAYPRLPRGEAVESQQRRFDEMMRMMDEMPHRPAVAVESYPFEQGVDADIMRDELAAWVARYAAQPIARL